MLLGAYVLARFTFFGVSTRNLGRHLPTRFLAPLGLFAGFVDATGGGGWGPVGTPALLASGHMEPRKVIGTIDASEFLVAIAASLGFLVGLGGQGIVWWMAIALLLGGLIAAPIAAWLVRHLPPRILGSAAGTMIVLVNIRSLISAFDVPAAAHTPIYLGAGLVGAAAISWAGRSHLRAKSTQATPPAAAEVPSEDGTVAL
nr:sulfite exporter TauE/SafE family protein [Tessaracoccus coleopterorum]